MYKPSALTTVSVAAVLAVLAGTCVAHLYLLTHPHPKRSRAELQHEAKWRGQEIVDAIYYHKAVTGHWPNSLSELLPGHPHIRKTARYKGPGFWLYSGGEEGFTLFCLLSPRDTLVGFRAKKGPDGRWEFGNPQFDEQPKEVK